MSYDFYSSEWLVREHIGSIYQEAEAERLANSVRKNSRIRHSMLKSAGQALGQVTQVLQAWHLSISGNHPSHANSLGQKFVAEGKNER